MADFTQKVLRELKAIGCYEIRAGKGSHSTWYSPVTNCQFTMVSSLKKRTTANGILKQAGSNLKV